ncbi:MAG: NAD(P)H-dependent oxidoreductase [Lachnospiraceae bacterium]|nr:NAD(P)H-dependent oxidoreductase [Lachnospiraceae bacterium]
MKIIIINGSHRKNGATALILHEMYQKLETYPNVEIQFYNVADLNLKYCVGCCKCYKNGKSMALKIVIQNKPPAHYDIIFY